MQVCPYKINLKFIYCPKEAISIKNCNLMENLSLGEMYVRKFNVYWESKYKQNKENFVMCYKAWGVEEDAARCMDWYIIECNSFLFHRRLLWTAIALVFVYSDGYYRFFHKYGYFNIKNTWWEHVRDDGHEYLCSSFFISAIKKRICDGVSTTNPYQLP